MQSVVNSAFNKNAVVVLTGGFFILAKKASQRYCYCSFQKKKKEIKDPCVLQLFEGCLYLIFHVCGTDSFWHWCMEGAEIAVGFVAKRPLLPL